MQVNEFSDELDEKEALIEFNRQRSKTYSQQMNEAELLTSIYSERNKIKMVDAAKKTAMDIISNQPINSKEGSATLHNPPVDKSKSLSVNTRTDKDVAEK